VTAKGSAPLELVRSELRDEKRFPGKFSGEGKPGTSSIYLKEVAGSSTDDRAVTTDVMVLAKGKAQGAARAPSSVVTVPAVAARPAPAPRSRARAPVVQEDKVPEQVVPAAPAAPAVLAAEKERKEDVQDPQTSTEPCATEVAVAQEIVQDGKKDKAEAPPAGSSAVDLVAKDELEISAEETMKPPAPPRSHKKGASKSSAKSVSATSPPASPKSTVSAVSSQQSHPKASSGKPKYSELVALGITESAQSSPRADSFSPPKKRAASSLAQFNISMQLKGDTKPVESSKARTGSASPPHKRPATSATTTTTIAAAKKASAPTRPGENTGDSSDEEGELLIVPQRVTRSREQDAQLSTRSGKKLLSGSDLLPGLD
jgi:hypothetical protein